MANMFVTRWIQHASYHEMFWHLYIFSIYLLSHISSFLSAEYPCDNSCQLIKYKINHNLASSNNPHATQKGWNSQDVKEKMWSVYSLRQSTFQGVSLLRINRKATLRGNVTAFLCLLSRFRVHDLWVPCILCNSRPSKAIS